MEKRQIAKLTQLLKRIQNIARQEKAEKTMAAIENAIKHETKAAKKRVAARIEALKKAQQKGADAAKKVAPRRRPATTRTPVRRLVQKRRVTTPKKPAEKK
jgi:nucleoid-associated protein YgaU